jgi:hypothetical protein
MSFLIFIIFPASTALLELRMGKMLVILDLAWETLVRKFTPPALQKQTPMNYRAQAFYLIEAIASSPGSNPLIFRVNDTSHYKSRKLALPQETE